MSEGEGHKPATEEILDEQKVEGESLEEELQKATTESVKEEGA